MTTGEDGSWFRRVVSWVRDHAWKVVALTTVFAVLITPGPPWLATVNPLGWVDWLGWSADHRSDLGPALLVSVTVAALFLLVEERRESDLHARLQNLVPLECRIATSGLVGRAYWYTIEVFILLSDEGIERIADIERGLLGDLALLMQRADDLLLDPETNNPTEWAAARVDLAIAGGVAAEIFSPYSLAQTHATPANAQDALLSKALGTWKDAGSNGRKKLLGASERLESLIDALLHHGAIEQARQLRQLTFMLTSEAERTLGISAHTVAANCIKYIRTTGATEDDEINGPDVHSLRQDIQFVHPNLDVPENPQTDRNFWRAWLDVEKDRTELFRF